MLHPRGSVLLQQQRRQPPVVVDCTMPHPVVLPAVGTLADLAADMPSYSIRRK